ncbi:GNAT family N-acetyltransferase [Actinoalloteichus hymeniacidonis]|uniref:Acetyltransferase (GNAT) family protein n=1 Tax=Actinoalloteichus hymeniacidonis TaxID=340345 RepID=A0AAC9HNW5_9PSEU|nr:GNAT family N-acetyltransferase [Actinoalloteichus hymeniacidonis]AOS62862.1 acetyltransferase (GNAT) family protein [Actinoalloteichus hymeniacidonis]MBB5909105.1 GNAT superfamily N-acetyltransferase [Actinoalloteichus hymeniacidonis]
MNEELLPVDLHRLDPLLPDRFPQPRGPLLHAALPDGRRVSAACVVSRHPPGSIATLWSARWSCALFPLSGAATESAELRALVEVWRAELDRLSPPAQDSACEITWPSRDVDGTRVFLDHCLMPLTVLAVRTSDRTAPIPRASGTTVRRATPSDLDAAAEIALHETRYSALVGGTMLRPDHVELKRAGLRARLAAGAPVWLAERDGLPVGLAECSWSTVRSDDLESRLRPGTWGYVNCLSVLPTLRGGGVGSILMAAAHRHFTEGGASGTYLYYNPANPLSTVFWPTQGYRPLWTVWEVRPAAALR